MRVVFIEEASREFSDASDYYDRQEPRLGQRFEEEIDWAIRWLVQHPESCRLRHGAYRRMNLHIFPYYIPYIVRGSTLWVLAIAQSQRRPEYWIRRATKIEQPER